jgi:signal transduction histidine kinase
MGFIYYKNYQNKQKVKLQKEILHQQDLATKAVMNAEDNERKRMATHLHDGIGQLLTAANMNISVLDDFKKDEDNFTKVLSKTKEILSEAILDVRTLSHQIMPNMLIKNSLSDALRDLISKTNSPKLHIELKIDGLKNDLDQNIQVVMYRIIQECINNTIKHAQANKVEISLLQNKEMIEAIFKDDGIGFNPLKISSKNDGLGLDNIKSRIDMLKGDLKIISAKGEGTSIIMKIPV